MTSVPSSTNTETLAFAVPPSSNAASSPVTDLFQGLMKSPSQEGTNQKSTPTIDEEVLAGLSPAEREAFLNDQKQMMEQIEAKPPTPTATPQSAAALAFNQRSSQAVAQIAASYETGVAPEDSGAVTSASAIDFKAAQIDEDAKLAAKLQEEEYAAERRRNERRRARAAAQQNNGNDNGESWYDWMMGTSPPAAATTSSATANGGASRSAGAPAAAAAAGGGGARVAQSSSMFSCVGNAIATAINPPKQVSGVDSTSLLSIS